MTDATGLETARLALRRFTPDDFEWYARLEADPEVKRHMGGPASRETSARVMRERILDYYDAHPGMGIWMTLERASGAPVGFHLINHIRGDTLIQVGYVLDRAYWGRGYATEMCLALIRYGFTQLALPRIVGIVNPENAASQKVLRKSGLERRGERSFAAYSEGRPLAFFERERDAWLAEYGR